MSSFGVWYPKKKENSCASLKQTVLLKWDVSPDISATILEMFSFLFKIRSYMNE